MAVPTINAILNFSTGPATAQAMQIDIGKIGVNVFADAVAVIVDVSIDTGGCFESSEVTTHEKPTFIKNNVIHYCVPNIPSRYSKTASISISNIITPFLLHIAEDGGIESAIRCNRGLKHGIYSYHGLLTNKAIADWFNLEHRDISIYGKSGITFGRQKLQQPIIGPIGLIFCIRIRQQPGF